MVGYTSRKILFMILSASMVGISVPAQAVSLRNRVKSATKIGLVKIKKFVTFDYLCHCNCPDHKKNQTLKNQIKRHPERLGIYMAAGTGLLLAAYRLFASSGTPVVPVPPIIPEPVPQPPRPPRPPVPPVNPIPGPAPVVPVVPINVPVVPAPEPEPMPVVPAPEPALAPAPQPNFQPLEIEYILFEAPQEQQVEEVAEPEGMRIIEVPVVIRPRLEPLAHRFEIQQFDLQEPEVHQLGQVDRIFGIPRVIQPRPLPVATAPKPDSPQPIDVERPRSNSKGKEEADDTSSDEVDAHESDPDEGWTLMNNSLIKADPTPGFGAMLTIENWNRLSEVGQIASGKLEPIISFMQKDMPRESKKVFDGMVRAFFEDVLFSIERDHVPTNKPVDAQEIKAIFLKFQERTIPHNYWQIAANSSDEAEIANCKVLFWLNAAHEIERRNNLERSPSALVVISKLIPIAREMAQEIITPQGAIPARVRTDRKLGGISTQEHEWINNKRLPRVLEAQKRILNSRITARFGTELEEPLKIGLCLSGGGYRAMTLSAGYLTALHKLGLVDAATHVSGLSGSTWFLMRWLLSNPSPEICKDELKRVIPRANLLHLFSNQDKLDIPRLVHDVIIPKAVFHKPITSVDLYGGLLARALLTDCVGARRHQITMADIGQRIESGEYPFPICTAISETTVASNKEKWYNWIEYNPLEVENNTLGLSVPAKAYGNKFRNGVSQQVSPPECLGSLMATWGSAYTINFADQIDQAKISGVAAYAASVAANRILPAGLYKDGRISPAQTHNPFYQLPNEAVTQRFESTEHATAITQPELCTFNDAGIDFNLPLIPLLKRARGLDVIIVGDASGSKKIMEEKTMPDGKTPCPKELAKFFQSVERYGILYERKNQEANALNFSIYVPQNPNDNHAVQWIEGEKLPIIIFVNFIMTPETIERGMQNEELKGLIKENNLEKFDAQACLRGYGGTFNFEYSSDNFKQLAAVGELNVLAHKEEIMRTLVDAYAFRRAQEFKKG